MKPEDSSIGGFPASEHPTAGELAAFTDGGLPTAVRRRLEAHLAECVTCRDDLRIAMEAVQRTTGAPRRRWLAGAAATAAALALLLLAPGMLDDSPDAVLRGPGDAGRSSTAGLAVVSPAAGQTVSADGPRFVWRSAGPEAQYRFHLATAGGEPMVTVTTPDTVVTALEDARLIPGAEYYWWVDALLADRSTLDTGLQRIVIVR